jgi:hypothetical protein
MSINAISAVLERSKQHGNALLTLVVIAEHADREGAAWPSAARIAQRARIDMRSCWRILRQLQRDNEIAIERGGGRGRSNRYRILLLNSDTANSDSRNTDRRNSDLFDETVTKRAQNSDSSVTRTVIIEPSLEPLGAHSRKRRPETELPTDFSLTESDRDFLRSRLPDRDANSELERFVAYHQSRGSRMRDWHAAWRTWVLNAQRYERDAATCNGKAGHSSRCARPLPPPIEEVFKREGIKR